jgi:hypothetical protein
MHRGLHELAADPSPTRGRAHAQAVKVGTGAQPVAGLHALQPGADDSLQLAVLRLRSQQDPPLEASAKREGVGEKFVGQRDANTQQP